MDQEIRFCTAVDGVRIAYATSGAGPPLVKAANWLTHLEFDWESPVWRHWLGEMSRRHTLIRYDERGCGLSDWQVANFSFEAWVRDLETVVDAAGLDRFALLGISQGGAVAINYTVHHPEKVTHLILYGSYAVGRAKRNVSREEAESDQALKTLARVGWGWENPAIRQVFSNLYMPEASQEQLRWLDELQKKSTSTENAVRFYEEFGNVDVRDLLPQVSVPTLVLHARGDARVPHDVGRDLAAAIPGARFVSLDSKNHILMESEPAWERFVYEVFGFLGTRDAGGSAHPGAAEGRDKERKSEPVLLDTPVAAAGKTEDEPSWARIEEVFDGALKIPAAHRSAWVTKACRGDRALLREVLGMLEAHEKSHGVLEKPVPLPMGGFFAPGETISHFRIIEKLGEGGMGEVWKAEDTQLGRQVALKFLSPHLVSDSEIRRRFEREAKAAASLNHPNICTVYEIGEANGRSFLAMELVKGESLQARIEKGPLPLQEVLDVAKQLAQGLQEAHAAGVVHRDIKPANVMVTMDGRVKILDFGLALLTEGSKLTKLDTALGTVAYMSPEQAEGTEVDHCTDIWALGCVLYEMVSGQKPFRGHYDQAVVYSIVNEDPEPLTGLRSDVPMEFEFVVDKCLAKKVEQRTPSAAALIGDLSAVGERLRRSSSFSRSSITQQAAPRSSQPRPAAFVLARRPGLLLASGVLLCSLVAFWVLRPSESGLTPVRTHFTFPAPASSAWGGGVPVVSPGGEKIAFVSEDRHGVERIYIRALDSPVMEALAGTEGAYNPFWAPDGASLGFFAEGHLKRVSTSGGPAKILCDAQGGAGASWSPSGEIVFSPGTRAALQRVSAEGGEPRAATLLEAASGENSHRWPQFLPDGRHFLFLARAATPEDSAIYVASLDGEPRRRLFSSQSNAIYTSAPEEGLGALLFVQGAALMAQPMDPETLAPKGAAYPIAEQIRYVPVRHLGLFSASADGRIIAFREGESEQRQLHWFDRSGKHLGSPGPPGPYDQIRLSPDGKRVSLTLSDKRTGKRDVWVMRLDSGALERITFNAANDWCPVWSPDGRQILFASDRGGVSNLYVKDSLGAGEPEELYSSPEPKFPSDWSRDAAFVAYHYRRGSAIDIGVLAIEDADAAVPFLSSRFVEPEAYFSPDGAWLAYASNETGKYEIYIRSHSQGVQSRTEAPAEKRQVSSAGGTDPRWSPDSGTLFYLAPDRTLMEVDVTGSVSPPKELFRTCSAGFLWDGSRQSYDVAPDGRSFLMSCPVEETVSSRITVLTGWRPRAQ